MGNLFIALSDYFQDLVPVEFSRCSTRHLMYVSLHPLQRLNGCNSNNLSGLGKETWAGAQAEEYRSIIKV